jgi:hypothetical protein
MRGKMKKIISILALASLALLMFPLNVFAAGILASGGGSKTVGTTFSVNVIASGAEFNAFQGAISTTGPVSVVSVTAGNANWMSQPSANGAFAGALLGQKVTSFTIATIKLRGTSAGSGAVSVSGVILKSGASTVGTSGGSTSFTITKAPELPGTVAVTSATHPDQNTAYEATSVELTWNKESGVDGFSYLIDQTADTTPTAKITDANTSTIYSAQAIGTYYFHIRAHKADGWGSATHFRINIKEPDPKIDATLSAPSNIEIEKSADFVNNIEDGTVTGIIITGQTIAEYTANITLTPTPTLPEGRTMTVLADESGHFELLLDFPIVTGFHTLVVQGQLEKILTPLSEKITFEIIQSKGGSINILTADDADTTVVKAAKSLTFFERLLNNNDKVIWGIAILIPLIIIAVVVFIFVRKSKLKNFKIK